MIFAEKTIYRKLVIQFIVLLIVLGIFPHLVEYANQAGYIETFGLNQQYWQIKSISAVNYFQYGVGVFVIYAILAYFLEIMKPLKKIIREMQALLTGRRYHKIFTERVDEIGVIAGFFNEVTKNLGTVASSLDEQKRLSSELDLAAQLQKNILPTETPSIPGLSIVTKTRSAVEIGGDSFDFIEAGAKTYMYIGDVTGHGIPAALIMTMAHALIRVFAEEKDNAYDIMVATNKHLKKHLASTMFMTMLMLCWDNENKKMSFVGAGHEHLLVFRSETGECEKITTGGIALGMVPDNSKIIKETELELNEDDFILAFTDGIVEARNSNDEMYGIERLQEKFTDYAVQYNAAEVHQHLAMDFANFVGNQTQLDDITLMVIQRVADNKETKSETKWHDLDSNNQ